MYAAATAIKPKHASRPYIHGRAASAGPPETRAWTNPTRQTSTATVSSIAPVRRIFGTSGLEARAAGAGLAGARIVEAETRTAREVDDGAVQQSRAGAIDGDPQRALLHQGVVGPGVLDEVEVVGEPVAPAGNHCDPQQPALDLRLAGAGEHRLRGAFGEGE